jgi:hypothetical protein
LTAILQSEKLILPRAGEALTLRVSPATGGSDTYVFSPQNGNDTIHDFEHIDTIELDGFFSNPHIPSQVGSHIPRKRATIFCSHSRT